ncbi:glutamate 5-kinase [Ferrovum sp. PN-J185]|uniref:glutamate 5-kinase n=1 Tax=Ferrovum sp. PN-J185 TaxID=1356306 RepID=UPI001E2F75F6|nr:glutamate 5-kinase [Ferrovum sp. PN-J185]MCC6068437.1 glutamate 5-kinase [Ferrovum sp. PN-J185]MDE1891543.1 glutamate 5-kinase [Betaproteobacteria bacterium]MDE2055877.1 glutamate 5-kinase [Betaproteobacteria bacterium]
MKNNSFVKNSSRLVIKIGSSLLTNDGQGLDRTAISQWVEQMARLNKETNKTLLLVSSGAVAQGMKRLGLSERPRELPLLQAAAAVGQMGLAQMWESCFSEHGLTTAQVLLTHEDFADRTRYLNARSTLLTLIDMNVIPIINENDTVATDEIRLGDNDTLGALVAGLVDAEGLIILTDQPGLFNKDPRHNPDATLINEAIAGDASLESMAGGAGSSLGKGGMLTKVLAAKRAATRGAHTAIVSGRENNVLCRLAAGELIGTQLIANTQKLSAKQHWLASQLQVKGQLVLDEGAVLAVVKEGKSVLPIGVKLVQGQFNRGELVACLNQQNIEIARGLINYNSQETQQILGKTSDQIESTLGFVSDEELIHRDNLVCS